MKIGLLKEEDFKNEDPENRAYRKYLYHGISHHLGIDVHDATSGFRVFRRQTLEKIDLHTVRSAGYVFQTDLVTRCLRAGLVVREVPIEFIERVRGQSKMSGQVAVESLRRITQWGLRERWEQARGRGRP